MKITIIILSLLIGIFSCGKVEKGEIAENLFYTCSMDPQVMEKKPGKCPICKMELTKITIDKNASDQGISLSEEQIQLGNIQTIIVKDTAISSVTTLNGTLVINQNNISKINSRVAGRIEKLYIKNVGESIEVGMKLYDIYSEELSAAQQEYLMTLEKIKKIPNASIDYKQLLEASRNKLLLWGLTSHQIKFLEQSKIPFSQTVSIFSKEKGIVSNVMVTEGSFIMEGDPVFEISELKNLWVEAQLYPGEINELQGDDMVEIRVDAIPQSLFKSKINFATPQLQSQSKINIIRAEIPNKDQLLKPGMHAVVSLKSKFKNSIAIPNDAVLQDSKGASVWVKTKENKFENRKVIIGIESNNLVEVRSGIAVGEEIVISGVYLLNSEYIFKKGSKADKI